MGHSRFMLYSLFLHTLAGGLLVFSLNETPARTIQVAAAPQIVKAHAVDSEQVEKELQRLQDIEQTKLNKQRELEKRLKELEQKKARTEKQRQLEEKKLAELTKKNVQEQARRKKEQQKIARLKKEQDELEKKNRKAEAERELAEQKKRQAEAEHKRLEKQAAEQKRRAEEQRRREAELAEEQRQLEDDQAQADQRVIKQYGLRIRKVIEQSFNTTGLPDGLSCILQIRMIPGGEVVEARVVKTSGNEVFDRRAETAVNKAAPLPVPDEPRQFERMRELRLTFAPQNPRK